MGLYIFAYAINVWCNIWKCDAQVYFQSLSWQEWSIFDFLLFKVMKMQLHRDMSMQKKFIQVKPLLKLKNTVAVIQTKFQLALFQEIRF